jgi:antitoxin component YwqK of YwqJK toxin-antitoxin module
VYYESGVLKREEIYKDDRMISETCYDEKGDKIKPPDL